MILHLCAVTEIIIDNGAVCLDDCDPDRLAVSLVHAADGLGSLDKIITCGQALLDQLGCIVQVFLADLAVIGFDHKKS